LVTVNLKIIVAKNITKKIAVIALVKKKGCLKRQRKQCKYGDFCRRYNIDQSCEFQHFHDNKEVDNLPAGAEESTRWSMELLKI
jgi:hypothetical protein